MGIGDKLKDRRKELGLTMLEVAQKSNVSEATVSRWESGDIVNMRRDKIVLLAKALQVSPSFIMDLEDNDDAFIPPTVTSEYVTFPVIGNIAAGYDSIAIEDWSGETIDVPLSYLRGRPQSDYFVLKVKGNSMYPLYHDGDTVLILKQTTLNRSGEIGAILYDNEYTTLKKVEYVMGEDWLILIPLNPEYPPERIEGARLESCRVIGIPTLLIREIQK